VYLLALDGLVLRVEHVGSTAVPGLSAKPIIDIDVVIRSRPVLPDVIARLATLGYRHQGDLDIPGREAFASNNGVVAPTDGTRRLWPAHNLYVCAEDSDELHRHLRFRDWLRANAAGAAEYAKLKAELAAVHRHDRDAYTLGKTAFVEAALRS
jgi:GrpB-like predicted nucleotidyltransferase (UPF0157 family)